jgi:niacin transporter
MNTANAAQAPTLPSAVPVTHRATGGRAISLQLLLLFAASVLLPAAAHLSGLSVRVWLPMHWPVLLAGLLYGWRSGALVGVAAPGLSYLVSGMPYPPMLPAMAIELGAYGLVAGFLRERLRWNPFLATATAIVAGRLIFVAVAVATGATGPSLPDYARAALLPGVAAAVAQAALLPLVALAARPAPPATR